MVPTTPRPRGSVLLRLLFVPCVFVGACAAPVADEEAIPIIGTDGKADEVITIGPTTPGAALRVTCPASEGCAGSIGLRLHPNGPTAHVTLWIGRTFETLEKISHFYIDGDRQPIVLFDVPATEDVPVGGPRDEHDPIAELLVVVRTVPNVDTTVTVEMAACVWDAEERTGVPPALPLAEDARFRTIHDGTDVDRLTFDVVDGYNLFPSEPLEVLYHSSSPGTEFDIHYECRDRSVLPFERPAYTDAARLSPDCAGIDDSGRIVVEVRDRDASPFVCVEYLALVGSAAL